MAFYSDIVKILEFDEELKFTKGELLGAIEKLEAEHPYRVSGRHETYDPYNQGWSDALDRVSQLLEVE